jgi:hypothetical protein
MGYVPYVGFATYRRATVKIHLYFKRLMFMQMFCIYILKKKGHHTNPNFRTQIELLQINMISSFKPNGYDKIIKKNFKP